MSIVKYGLIAGNIYRNQMRLIADVYLLAKSWRVSVAQTALYSYTLGLNFNLDMNTNMNVNGCL